MSDLDAQWNEVRVRLLLLAEGSVTAWNKSGAGGKPGHRVLADTSSNTQSAVDVFYRRWVGARSDDDRVVVIADAWAHVRHECGHGRPKVASEDSESLRERVLKARGWSPKDISQSSAYLRTPESTVRKWRRDAGQDPETGRDDERARRVRELAKANVSQREIARQVDMSQATVNRVLRRAA